MSHLVYAQSVNWPHVQSHFKTDPTLESAVENILNQMSLEEKVGQMVQAEIKHITPEEAKQYSVGSVLNGGGSFPNNNKYSSLTDWLNLADEYFLASTSKENNRTAVPLIWGTDAVHGHNNVFGATIFPHNIGLGATNNDRLIERIGQITALEVLATGIDWVFAPTVAVVRNDRWGRSYEGYSENPELVKKLSGPMVYGLQGRNQRIEENYVIATAKHFIGDGGTFSGIDQGDNRASEQELLDIHGQGYLSSLAAGAQTVMASFNSWRGKKIHGHKYLLTDVLKNKLGFDGFVIGDWNGHGQVNGCTNSSCAQAINAGVDMLMAPKDWKELIKNTLKQVKTGEISVARINDAVRRILRVKMRAKLFENVRPSMRKNANLQIGTKEHRDVARKAVRESLVLLKNKNQILPLDPKAKVLVMGSVAHDIGRQSGGWTLTWQGTGNTNSDFPGATSIFDGINQVISANGGSVELSFNGEFQEKPDYAIVVFGEKPYAEGQGDINDLYYGIQFKEDLVLLQSLKAKGIPVVSVFITGRPMWMNPEINASDAFVVAWLPGSEGAGVSDVLFKNQGYDFSGKLPFSWPKDATQGLLNPEDSNYKPLFPLGFGLTLTDIDTLGDNLSELPYPSGSIPAPEEKLVVFKGRTYSPFINYVGDFGNWKKPLNGDVGTSSAQLVTVTAIDKDIQEDARKISFHGGDSNYYFQSDSKIDLSDYIKNQGVINFDIRVDKKPDNEASILMGLGKMNFNQYLENADLKKWVSLSIPLECFVKRGTDFMNFDMPLSFATFGSMEISLANIELLKDAPKKSIIYNCK